MIESLILQMKLFILIFILTILFVGFTFAGFAIKMLFKKNGEFKRQCSSVDPLTGKRIGCSCNKTAYEKCEKHPEYSPLDINGEMLKEL